MKKSILPAVAIASLMALAPFGASAASLASFTCYPDYIDFGFIGVSGETTVTMEAKNDGSSTWNLIGGGGLDGTVSSVNVGIPTDDSEFTAIVPDVNAASFRAIIGSTTSNEFSCS